MSQLVKSEKSTVYCRRDRPRGKFTPSQTRCWNSNTRPKTVVIVEADARGARVVLSWVVKVGDELRLSVADSLGQFQTRTARVAWAQGLDSVNRTVVGLCFDSELAVA